MTLAIDIFALSGFAVSLAVLSAFAFKARLKTRVAARWGKDAQEQAAQSHQYVALFLSLAFLVCGTLASNTVSLFHEPDNWAMHALFAALSLTALVLTFVLAFVHSNLTNKAAQRVKATA